VTRILRRLAPALAVAAALALVTAAVAADAKGRIRQVTPDKGQIVMTDQTGTNWTINTAPDCKVRLNDKESKLADLQSDDDVQVTYEKDGDRLIASSIRATRR
jgi:hypothetical protein